LLDFERVINCYMHECMYFCNRLNHTVIIFGYILFVSDAEMRGCCQGDKQMRMPLHDDYKAEELITDVGGNAEGPEEAITVDEYLMPLRWMDEEKKTDEVLCIVIHVAETDAHGCRLNDS